MDMQMLEREKKLAKHLDEPCPICDEEDDLEVVIGDDMGRFSDYQWIRCNDCGNEFFTEKDQTITSLIGDWNDGQLDRSDAEAYKYDHTTETGG